MEPASEKVGNFKASTRQLAKRLLKIWENRLELLLMELVEERQRLLHALLLALGVAVFCLLSVMAFSAVLVILFWHFSPMAVLLPLAALFGALAVAAYLRLAALLRDWQTFPDTLDQFKKDRTSFEKGFE